MQNDENTPHKKSQIIKALQWFGVVAVSLLLVLYFLVVDTRGGQKTPVIGKVNGVPMYYAKDSIYGRTYQRLVNTYKQFGISTDGEMGRFISDLAFKEAASAMILEGIAEKNIDVSDKFVVEVLKNEFVDTNGIFLEEQYKAFLTRTPTSEKLKIQKDIKDSILQSMLSLELFGSIKPSSLEVKNNFMKNAVKRNIEMCYVDVAKIVDNTEIESAELQKYFTENKTNFALAEVSIIAVSSQMSADSIYNELVKKIKTDTNAFANVAKEKSEAATPDNNGYLGVYTKQEFPSPILGDAVFQVKDANTLIKPVFYNEKYYVILVHAITLPNTLEDVKIEIVENEYRDKNKTAMIEKVKAERESTLASLATTGTSLSSLNGKDGIEYYKSANSFSFNQGSIMDINSTQIPGSEDLSFYTLAFTTPVGELSKVVSLPNGIAVIKVLSETRPREEDYNNYITTNGMKMVRGSILQNTEKTLKDTWSEIEFKKAKVVKSKGF